MAARLSGNRPQKDQDTRRWFRVYNPTNKTIKPHSTILCFGKLFDNVDEANTTYTERDLPKFKNQWGESWHSLQEEIGFGNLIFTIWDVDPSGKYWTGGTYAEYGKVMHTNHTAIKPNGWGLATCDYPALARVRYGSSVQRFRTGIGLGYLTWNFHPSPKFDLVAEYTRYGRGWGWGGWGGWGWGRWGGWGGWGGWGSSSGAGGALASTFRIVDMVSGYGKQEGLAWVEPGGRGNQDAQWMLRAWPGAWNQQGFEIKDGDNLQAIYPYLAGVESGASGGFSTSLGSAVGANGVFLVDDKWLNFYVPGTYELDFTCEAYATDGTSPFPGINPWYGISVGFEVEAKEGGITQYFYGPVSVPNVYSSIILVPAVVTYEHYPQFSTIYADRRQFYFRRTWVVKGKEGFYDPYGEIDFDKPLARMRLNVARFSNHPRGYTGISMEGIMKTVRTEEAGVAARDLTKPQ